mgnify:CR=1 FL=1
MRFYKSNYTVNSLISEASRTSKRLNVSDLIRKNKQEEKREKIVHRKIETTLLDLLRSYASMNSKKAFMPLKFIRSSILTIGEALKYIGRFFSTNDDWVSLDEIIPKTWRSRPAHVKSAMATTFAASLELVKSGDLRIKQTFAFDSMKIKSTSSEEKG